MSADRRKALKVITGSSRFEASAERCTTAQAATTMVETFRDPNVYCGDVCRVYTPTDTSGLAAAG
ncbi:hypothetical protein PV464_24830, partial [Streptomyces scabiei]|nr:hypothetical protein [Streptomyces scabiei]